MATKVANSNQATHLEAASAPHKKPRILAGVVAVPADENRKKTLVLYENALRLMQAGKYDKAHGIFNEMLANAPHDLADRIRMYIAACVAQITKGATSFETHEERYDYAISLLNHGHYDDAREHFQAILLKNDTADYAFYGLALLSSMTGEHQKCIEHLTQAIRLNSQNRIQARSDSDFDGVADDPRFTELLYPEA
jgi:tetratricopeptide (TPR) repeat protein